jgi:hypothetical protein
VYIVHGATLAELSEHSTLGERRNVELFKSGSNIANYAWTNNHKIDFNSKHRGRYEYDYGRQIQLGLRSVCSPIICCKFDDEVIKLN